MGMAMLRCSVLLKVMPASGRPNSLCCCLALAGMEKFPSPAVPPPPAELGMAACDGFWRNLYLGLLFTLMLIPLLLSNDNDLKIPFYFPQIPPVVEVSFLFILILI